MKGVFKKLLSLYDWGKTFRLLNKLTPHRTRPESVKVTDDSKPMQGSARRNRDPVGLVHEI